MALAHNKYGAEGIEMIMCPTCGQNFKDTILLNSHKKREKNY